MVGSALLLKTAPLNTLVLALLLTSEPLSLLLLLLLLLLQVSAGVAAVSALRAKVGGGKDQGILTAEANSTMNYVPPTNVVPADSNAIAFARNTSEVLAIVYLGGKTSGGFFPTGLTGECATRSCCAVLCYV